ncbi:MAG: hypothetical protein DLM69_02725 [Candidatus Chloroheliales bacterium]|nr:MAG: hypothetical protein DLM69_02725 [Chloroflexota bacterium]
MPPIDFIIYPIIWILCGILAAFMYSKKGRSSGTGFWLGFFLGPIGVLIAAFRSSDRIGMEEEQLPTGTIRGGADKMMKVIAVAIALIFIGWIAWSQLSQNKDNEAIQHYNDGVNHYAAGQKDLALADYNKAIELKPDYADAYNNRGLIYYDKTEYDLALADFNQVIKLDPTSNNGFNNRGLVYMQKKEYDLALADFDQAIQRDLSSAMSYSNRGLIYANKSEYDLAISDTNEAVKIDPSYYRAYYVRGLTYETKMQTETTLPAIQADKDAAIADFRKVLTLNSDSTVKDDAQKQLNLLGG